MLCPDLPMQSFLHRSPSVGSITKKIMEINPELSGQEIIRIIRASVETQGRDAGEFAGIEMIDESRALALAKATLPQRA